ncbi:MAG TPA: YIP1 family protein [Gemmatimonadales bacterium]|nr:YIP1 family protein [Gemmatimonadales bacterium]
MGAALDLFNVLHEPTAVFGRVKEKPQVLVPWLVTCVFLTVLAVLSRPYQAAAMDAIRATLTPEQAARIPPGSTPVWRTIVGTPVVSIISLLAGSGLLWLGATLAGGQTRFKSVMSVLCYSNMTYVIFAAVTMIVLSVRGVGAIGSFQDLRAPLGLDLLASGASPFLGQLLNGINPFSIWGVWLCGTGISITQGMSRASGILVTALAFLVGLLLTSAPLLLFSMGSRQ